MSSSQQETVVLISPAREQSSSDDGLLEDRPVVPKGGRSWSWQCIYDEVM